MDKQFTIKNITKDQVILSINIDGKVVLLSLNQNELQDLLFELNTASTELSLQGAET